MYSCQDNAETPFIDVRSNLPTSDFIGYRDLMHCDLNHFSFFEVYLPTSGCYDVSWPWIAAKLCGKWEGPHKSNQGRWI